MSIDVRASLDAAVSSDKLFAVVRDLATFPQWLDLVHSANPADKDVDLQAWDVELRAKIGPFARSKRLRMVRTIDEPDHVRFERSEADGRRHSAWVLDAAVTPTDGGARLTMSLHYGGSFGGGIVERLLRDEIDESRLRLQALVEQGVVGP